MTPSLLIKRTVIVASLALIPCGPVIFAQASDQPSAGVIPEVMTGHPSPQHDVLTPEVAPAQTIWVDEIRNSQNMYKKNYPTSNFDPYVKKLNV